MRAAKLSVAVLIAMPMIFMPIGALAQDQTPQPKTPQHQGTQEQSTQEPSTQEHATQGQARLEEGQASTSCIGNFTFSQEFLSRYPDAGAACREVKMQDGQKWARFDSDVTQVRGRRVTANFVDRFDKSLGTITFDAAPDARVQLNGRPTSFALLRAGDKMSVWMPEGAVGFYAEPGASESTKLAVVSTTPAQR